MSEVTLDEDNYATFRKRFVTSIIQTDMKFHGEHIKVAQLIKEQLSERAAEREQSSSRGNLGGSMSMHSRASRASGKSSRKSAAVRSSSSQTGTSSKDSASELSGSFKLGGNRDEPLGAREVDGAGNEVDEEEDEPLGEDMRQNIVEVILHAADIGNPVMKVEQSLRWKDRILREFAAQGESEARLGLPVTPFMIGLDSHLTQLKSQLGFINFVVAPYYDLLSQAFAWATPHAHLK